MGSGEHDHRRAHGARSHSEAEGCRRAGHRRVPAEQDRALNGWWLVVGRSMKTVEATNRRAVKALLAPERVRDEATERRVATIVADVRRGGDRALLRYARELDRLNGPIEVTPAE